MNIEAIASAARRHPDGERLAVLLYRAVADGAGYSALAGIIDGWCAGWASGSVGRLRQRTEEDMRQVRRLLGIARGLHAEAAAESVRAARHG